MLTHQTLQVITALIITQSYCLAKQIEQFERLHKNVSKELILIRKDFSPAQERVYSLLDNIDKMSSITKNILAKKRNYKTQYLKALDEAKARNKEYNDLERAYNEKKDQAQTYLLQLEQERERTQFLERQQQELTSKINLYDETLNQSLSRTSTSEPISPR